ncbi:MAG: hypothetical protein ACT4QF_16290 [Sporichthyaceae bacterium]
MDAVVERMQDDPVVRDRDDKPVGHGDLETVPNDGDDPPATERLVQTAADFARLHALSMR